MMHMPPVQFMVLANFGALGWGYAGDPAETMDDAADLVAEVGKHGEEYPVRVLRITDTCNCDDVTADAFAVIEARLKARAA